MLCLIHVKTSTNQISQKVYAGYSMIGVAAAHYWQFNIRYNTFYGNNNNNNKSRKLLSIGYPFSNIHEKNPSGNWPSYRIFLGFLLGLATKPSYRIKITALEEERRRRRKKNAFLSRRARVNTGV